MTLTEASGYVDVPPDDVGGGVMPCPEGMNPVSGGFDFEGFGEVFISRRQANGWQAAAQNFSTTETSRLTVYVYCAPGIQFAGSAPAQRLQNVLP